ncbi:serine/threonine-protein kinase [uncultured Massilia sp.]|uniref:serine/threonine-protein kinase n=1 Tax=uncultured Massilia sp. TaxID=169973 RepID=UPI0025DE4DDA|nr:serine/threonine-protein kinase [uncultured Massilia sp.]
MAVPDDVLPPRAPSAAALPASFGHYAFRARLGEGGQGEVYEAWDSKLQRSVAIKRIRHDGTATAEDLVREARMAASLRHPAFVKVHAVEDVGSSQFIVMELVPGRTLKQVLADGKPDVDAALDWVRQVALAMRDAHASGLVHGDLKPSNVMIEPDGKVRILDFGLALRQDALATTTVTQSEPCGTIAYMAPERLLGGLPDERGDVYALGVMLYEVLVGRRPFSTLNGLALAAAHVQSSSDSWEYPDSIDTPLIALIRAMTARQAEHRIPTMADVLRRIGQDASGPVAVPVVPVDAGAAPRALWAPRSRASLVAGAAAAVVLAAGGAWWMADFRAGPIDQHRLFYSEANEMGRGLAALKLFDRPGELEKAEAAFKQVLDHNPDSAGAAAGISLAYNLRYAGDRQDEIWLQKASASAQLSLKLDPQLALGHIANGAVMDSEGQFDRALGAYDHALRLDPGNYFAWYGKVESLRHARRYPEALAALADAIKRFPKERVFADELGTTYFAQENYQAAEQAFRHSIALQPDAVLAYANLNAVLLHQNRNDEALRVLQQGLQVRPNAKLYSNLGNALFLRGDYVGAAEAFENAVSPTRGAPGKYLYWANLGDTLLWLPGREQQARQAYARARDLLAPQLQRSPDDVVLVSRMGLYAARAGEQAQAIALMQHAVALAPKDAKVQFRAGLAYELLGKRDLALQAIGAARRLGYPSKLIDAEPDLINLRRDPAYQDD